MARRKSFVVVWAETALADLEGIGAHASLAALAALRVLDRIERRASRLRFLPLRGRIVPELAKHSICNYRELILSPWRIIYRVENKRVWVLAVFDERRSLEDVLLDRFLRSRP